MRRGSTLLRGMSLLAAGLVLAGCGAGAGDPSAAGSPMTSSDPAPSPTTTSPTPTPTPTPPPGPRLTDLDWYTGFHTGQPIGLVRNGRGYFGIETRGLASLTHDGRVRWRFDGPRTDDFDAFVVDGTPVVSTADNPKSDETYADHTVTGLDPRTGRARWHRPATSSYTFAGDGNVVAPTCVGPRGSVTCTLTAYDAKTGATRWATALPGDVENSDVWSSHVLVQSFPDGSDPRFSLLDLSDGAVESTFDMPQSDYLYRVGTDLLVQTAEDLPVSSGCHERVVAYRLDGSVVWTRTFQVRPQHFEKKSCDSYSVAVSHSVVVLSALDAPALVLDPRTGRTLWRDSLPGGFSDVEYHGVLLIDEQERGTKAISLGRRTLGRTVWRSRTLSGSWIGRGGLVATNTPCPGAADYTTFCTVVRRIATGRTAAEGLGVPKAFVPAAGHEPPGLLLRIDSRHRYAARYGYLSVS